ncbi:MAG TPA: hypothetical protein VJ884_02405, partial [Salinibacter sp.]|nr:hypothetical protein [Salinibacter sp.]
RGIGLQNMRERLQRHYPGRHRFALWEEEGWVHARIVVRSPNGKRDEHPQPAAAEEPPSFQGRKQPTTAAAGSHGADLDAPSCPQ